MADFTKGLMPEPMDDSTIPEQDTKHFEEAVSFLDS